MRLRVAAVLVVLLSSAPSVAAADDPVLDWNRIMNATVLAGGTGPLPATRATALVQAAVFDAINGVERRYDPIHVRPDAPSRASGRAAAIQAAYAMLLKLYPAQAATLLTKRNESLLALLVGRDAERPGAIARGVEWGQTVADAIWDWRSTDGFAPNPPPPFRGANVTGVWRPTPPGHLDGAGPNFASMTPWVLTRPSQFRPGPPPALNSPEYTADFDEVKAWGRATGSLRSADDDVLIVFWTGNTPLFWNRVAAQLLAEGQFSQLGKARALAKVNLAMADAAIACWDSKYRYVYWRPVTAVPAGDDDGNADTVGDATFVSAIVTPNFPEYLSGHSTVSGAATVVLESIFGDARPFTGDTEILLGGAPIPDRSFASFSAALDEIVRARVYGGIHFRTACDRGTGVGRLVAEYVLRHAVRPAHGHDRDRE